MQSADSGKQTAAAAWPTSWREPFFFLALFFAPLVKMIGGDDEAAGASKLFTGRGKEVPWLVYLMAVLFVLYFVYLQAK